MTRYPACGAGSSESLRLEQTSPVRGLFLAGDWTRTALPSTMESAAESARRPVGAVRRSSEPAASWR
ncbi:FAD-dependent oxidoreductase [Nocardia aobensis]|uniref:FAD-dependent oxidoreductase n=1 Tax=Nocardia aobensis TaxID=257277 RepID=UPI0003025809|nr:FAD-dependent oxidoreductase [Nocardia aobensis]